MRLLGELVNARKRLEGLERRIGIEGQQQEAEMRELRAGHERYAAEIGVLSPVRQRLSSRYPSQGQRGSRDEGADFRAGSSNG